MFQLRISTIRQQYVDWYKINKQSELWILNALTFWNFRNPRYCFKIWRYTSDMSKSVNYSHYLIKELYGSASAVKVAQIGDPLL